MDSRVSMEHFCTLFDIGFLPQGLALHASLQRHANPFVLWVLCMDDAVERALKRLALPDLRCIPLRDIETSELLAVKKGRSRAEYCWTMTPFLPKAVMDIDSTVQRVTYVDADCWFVSDPRRILKEMDDADKDVLITAHDYMPQYDQSTISGKYCVQFMPFRHTKASLDVLSWWQGKCLEWCFNKVEDGLFGDQKYLDHWLELFPLTVHELQNKIYTIAPWNALRYKNVKNIAQEGCMYHFHKLRIFCEGQVCTNVYYSIPRNIQRQLYVSYLNELTKAIQMASEYKIEMQFPEFPYQGLIGWTKKVYLWMFKNEYWSTLH